MGIGTLPGVISSASALADISNLGHTFENVVNTQNTVATTVAGAASSTEQAGAQIAGTFEKATAANNSVSLGQQQGIAGSFKGLTGGG